MDFTKELNKDQGKAIEAVDGPVLIIAGAGSGKTRTLTYRIAELICNKKISPRNILAVTFTNKAAKEMKERLEHLLKKVSGECGNVSMKALNIGTFHSTCAKILRSDIEKLGYEKTFNIIDDQDQQSIMKKVFAELEISTEEFKVSSMLIAISVAKNSLISAEKYKSQSSNFYEEIIAKVYVAYQKRLKESNSLDFDDLIYLTIRLFREFPETLKKYQETFKYIMVDEYQDTNHAQYTLIRMIADKYKNICVVGDDWQSIYGWRQADIRNILNFEKDYPHAKVISLEQNYRSTQIILDAAYAIISKNINRKDKKVWTENKEGQLISSFEAEDEREEAEYIASTVKKEIKENKSNYSDFAVLYRTNAQSRIVEELFLKKSIPYRIIGGIKFYQRKEVKDMIAYLRLIQNENDQVSLERIINEPKRGIGKATLKKWLDFSQHTKKSALTAASEMNPENSGIAKSKLIAISSFAESIFEWRELKEKLDLPAFLRKIFQSSGYEKMLVAEGNEGESKIDNIKELMSVAKKFKDQDPEEALSAFLEEVALVADTDKIDQDKDCVHLMTLHSSKGLEFETVFIIGLEEGIIPHSRSMLSEEEMEEERRLVYVGVTRAKRKVHLLFTRLRTIFGSTQANSPSRFLEDIPSELVEEGEYKKNFLFDRQSKKKPVDNKEHDFKDGDRVSHPEFGEGIIVSSDKENLAIVFPGKGIKKLSVAYAPIKKA